MRGVAPTRPFWYGLTRLIEWSDMAPIAAKIGYVPHPGQMEIHRCRRRFRVPVMGRRFGKSKCSAFEAVVTAVLGGWVMCVAPTYELSSIVFTEALEMLLVGQLKSMVVSYQISPGHQTIVLASGGRIVARTSENPKGLVGRGWDLIVFDEAAKEPDPEVWYRQLRPALSDRSGGAIFPSTPEGDTWFKDLFERGQSGVKEFASWQMPSSVNPLMTPGEIASLADGMTEIDYRQEILAEFVDATGAVFRGYREIATAEWQFEPIPGHRYVLGIDIAQFNDWTVIAVFDVTIKAFVHLIRFNQISYPLQERMISEASRKWNGAPIVIDATNNEAVAEHVAETVYWNRVDPFKFTMLSKAEVINQMVLQIEQKEIAFLEPKPNVAKAPPHLELSRYALSELGSYKYTRTINGTLRMNAPEGKHDDVVIAFALALECARRYSGTSTLLVATGESHTSPTISGTFGRQIVTTKSARPPRSRR